MSASLQAVQTRWDAFHAKLRERTEAILVEGETGCLAVFEQGGFDPFTMSNALPAIKRRIIDLMAKSEDTWHQQVDDALISAGASNETRSAEYDKGLALRTWMEAQVEAFEVRLHATASRILWARLGPAVPTHRNCTQCGSRMELPKAFTVVSVTCFSCKSVNTFDPGPAAILDGYAIRRLAHEDVWERKTGAEVLPKPERLRDTDTYRTEVIGWERRYGMREYAIQAPY